MEKISLDIVGLTYSQSQTGAYALILAETGGDRRLPIIIGSAEAHAIVVVLENMTPSRPLTHDLFRNFAETFNLRITEIIIYNLKEGIFFAKLICADDSGHEHEIDARTSDAVALAIRFGCPIYTFEFILAQAGVVFESDDSKEPTKKTKIKVPVNAPEFHQYTEDELHSQLNMALENEDYERASKIRDEIKKRSEK